MKRILFLLTLVASGSVSLFAQSIDSLKLSNKEIPAGYTLSKENNCISSQARIFYNNPGMYEMFIGKLKNKTFQGFESSRGKGSILYFEFDNGFTGKGFLDGLLWGGDMKPTKEHPEEYFAKGNFLIIWSFEKGSPVKKVSEGKVKGMIR